MRRGGSFAVSVDDMGFDDGDGDSALGVESGSCGVDWVGGFGEEK